MSGAAAAGGSAASSVETSSAAGADAEPDARRGDAARGGAGSAAEDGAHDGAAGGASAASLLSTKREVAPQGTFDDASFQAWADGHGAPGTFPLLGCLRAPSVWYYTAEVFPAQPLAYVSLPARPEALLKVLPRAAVGVFQAAAERRSLFKGLEATFGALLSNRDSGATTDEEITAQAATAVAEFEEAWAAIRADEAAERAVAAGSLSGLPPQLRVYAAVHGNMPPHPCGKLVCERSDEVNLFLHPWLHADVDFTPELVVNDVISVGVFCARGVEATHQDLNDGGVSFGSMSPRTVCIHDQCFSPCNLQMRLVDGVDTATWLTVALPTAADGKAQVSAGGRVAEVLASPLRDAGGPEHAVSSLHLPEWDDRAVVVLHALPLSDAASGKLREAAASASDVASLLTALAVADADVGSIFSAFVEPLT